MNLKNAKIQFLPVLAESHDSVIMRAKYQVPGGKMVSLDRGQVEALRNKCATSPDSQAARSAIELLGLIQAFSENARVHFRAYREIGDRQVDVFVAKDPDQRRPHTSGRSGGFHE